MNTTGLSNAELQRFMDYSARPELAEVYRHCLQAAGEYRCQMTPQDFVRYYELKALLDASQ